MSIDISWRNANTDLTAIHVLRANDATSEPVKIVELPGDAASYTDTTIAPNGVYYYVVRSIKGVESMDSERTPLGYFPDLGPGPKTIVRGDWSFGYFGQMSPSELVSYLDIMTVTKLNVSAWGSLTMWHKWVIGGKIVYIPNARYNATPATYTGVTGAAMWWDPAGTSSMMTVEAQGSVLGIRLPYVTTRDPTVYAPFDKATDPTTNKSEFAAMCAMFTTGSTAWSDFKYLDLVDTAANIGLYIGFSTMVGSTVRLAGLITSGATTSAAQTTGRALWPVLELLFDQ